ncbi:MAG TPA: DUF2961 domain-containing protein [Candidatus Hydrogenedentes bacterium]|mgnify:CR=1 FL=1|nr:DUF2961 domain-containing protein [Candidatus Hydrogenedentota bacterium]HOT49441.1 DUF2961 domain-containing protein [Candidatus Hydrogenedentota bacterium]HOV74181.1 DUF2961 domain-containing protein [Candidatus Hydrogenedentota bacterium]HPC15720.1 DUF2961 domain-containing protein [Candidatus Hydrogenedentota bacterium]HRT19656.1 DUF2961 domain-containing protein [Candidatus Hydrogenedentota bacterium]
MRAALMFSMVLAMWHGAWAAGLGHPLDGLAELKAGSTERVSSCDANWVNGNGDARSIAPGGTLTIAELEGPGRITHIWNTIASGERGYSRLLVLRMYWDGEEQPSVECPIGDFFCMGHGVDAPVQSLPVCVTSEGRGRNCYWPMPFRKSAKITVTNEGRKRCDAFYYYVDWHKAPKIGKKEAYFHAMYRQEFPAVMGCNYLLAEMEGCGHYVGTVLNVRQLTTSWWGEGDDFFFIDGAKEPQLRGTGSEDYLCDGWGLRKMSNPYYGCPLMEGYEPYALTTAYRWHIPDPVIFKKSLRVEIEHKGVTFNADGSMRSGFEERPDDFSSVAFWYQTEPHKPFPEMPVGYARLYYDFSSEIEAEGLISNVIASMGPVQPQDGGYSGGRQLFWTPSEKGQTLAIPFDVQEAGMRSMLLTFTHSWDYGIFQIELDGKPIGHPLDLYSATVFVRDKIFGPIELAPGTHTLTLRNIGKNAESKGYFLGLDGILMGK